jgi:anti-anti-sigma factor
MKMTVTQLDNHLTVIALDGRMDLEGTQAIDQQFSFQTTTQKRHIVVDLSNVSFLASIGIRTLLTAARGQESRGGKVVLAAPDDMVRKVLDSTGVDQIVPVYPDIATARAAMPA